MKKMILKYNLFIAIAGLMLISFLYYDKVITSMGGFVIIILVSSLYALLEFIKHKAK